MRMGRTIQEMSHEHRVIRVTQMNDDEGLSDRTDKSKKLIPSSAYQTEWKIIIVGFLEKGERSSLAQAFSVVCFALPVACWCQADIVE